MAVRTAKQKAALKKAQLASARKRKGKHFGERHGKKIALGLHVAAAAGFGALAYHDAKKEHNIRKHQAGSRAIRKAADTRRIARSIHKSKKNPHRFSGVSMRLGQDIIRGQRTSSPFSHNKGKTKLRSFGPPAKRKTRRRKKK